ncbi:MAG: FAD-dependent oxidoreductase [Verrucomicrobia bacterium]|nr:FAD-dependent oxidoreductase [Verrucomicrobiota bacterium]
MPFLTIDQRRIEAKPGATILQAARSAGIEIPTLCYLEGFEAGASCMVCAVKLKHNGQFIPACGSRVVDGMEVEHDTQEVRDARRMALELLFSDHLGDCLSPCQRICPAHLGIPAVLKHLRAGDFGMAAAAARRDLALAGILCRICHRPCEHGCRRNVHDDAVAIADLVVHAIDTELAAGEARVPTHPPQRQGRIAIIGSGFTGLSTAWFLTQQGYSCTVLDEQPLPAATIRAAFPDLPPGLLDAELRLLERAGVEFRCASRIAGAADLANLTREFAAVVLATGPATHAQAAALGLATDGHHLAADKHSMMTSQAGVFVAGRAVRPAGQPVNSVADGKAAAVCIHQYLTNQPVTRPPKPFSVFMGKVLDGEMPDFLQEASGAGRSDAAAMAVDIERAIEESKRCVHCNCAKADVCKLRQLAIDYDVNLHRFSSGERMRFHRNVEHPLVCFEAGKCIRCGNCIKVAGDHQEALGLTFVGRGFEVHLGVPFHESMRDGLLEAARAAVAACPTGALTLRED